MSQPTVAAVMLVNGREAMVRKAVECVRPQTYGSLELVFLDTTPDGLDYIPPEAVMYHHADSLTIGGLRNLANGLTDADIIVHFDSDDWSNPSRIEEQVALLQSSGADAVGYNQALFWREFPPAVDKETGFAIGGQISEAWRYSNSDSRYCLGASLCYWRRVWEKKPFEATSQGEDFRFCVGLKTVGVSAVDQLHSATVVEDGASDSGGAVDLRIKSPRIVCRIHGGNTSTAYSEETMRNAAEWRRAPEWDAYAGKAMAL